MTSLLPPVAQQFTDDDGVPLAGGTIDFYQSGTLTRKTVWADANQQAALTNPVVLDAGGSATIFGQGAYRAILKTAQGVTIWDGETVGAIPDGAVSAVMLPLLGSSTLQEFLDNAGITAAIQGAYTYAANLVVSEAGLRAAGDAAEATTRAAWVQALQNQRDLDLTNQHATDAALQAAINTINATLASSGSGTLSLRSGTLTTDAWGRFNVAFSPPFGSTVIYFTAFAPGATAIPGYWPELPAGIPGTYDVVLFAVGSGDPITPTTSGITGAGIITRTSGAFGDPIIETAVASTTLNWIALGL